MGYVSLSEVHESLTVGGKEYQLVKTRTYVPISVYKGIDTFLRLGSKDELEPEAQLHKKLLDFGFPVPNITADGEISGLYYYIEQSLGDKHLGEVFAQDMQSHGQISDDHFQLLLDLINKYATAQLRTATQDKWKNGFYDQIHLDYILEELPDMKGKTEQAMQKVMEQLKVFPAVLSHGDLNPWNLFEKGVIDIERFKLGPAGYDLISNIYSIYTFPPEGDYESLRTYAFTNGQRDVYLSQIDRIYTEHNLPNVSDYQDEYIISRLIFAAVRMHHRPKMQQWRYNLYQQVVNAYLNNQPIAELIVSFA